MPNESTDWSLLIKYQLKCLGEQCFVTKTAVASQEGGNKRKKNTGYFICIFILSCTGESEEMWHICKIEALVSYIKACYQLAITLKAQES